MKKSVHNILTCLVIIITITSVPCLSDNYWQQFVHYKIHAKLDTLTNSIDGIENLIYTNNSPDTLSELYFHLYPNAFQPGSIMAKEVEAASFKLIRTEEDLGWMSIDSLFIIKRAIISQHIKCETHVDDTILKIKIDPPLLPAEELSIWIKFRTKIHKGNPLIDKGGYRGNHYEISQWYPKICVYDQNGWNAMPYHWLGEFYGEFGAFDVTLDVPGSYIVGATGQVVSGDPGWDTARADSSQNIHLQQAGTTQDTVRRIVTFHAENVHDFMWVASPNFFYQSGIYKNIPIHILYQKNSHEKWHNNALNDAKLTLAWLEELVGEYPYPVLSICQGIIKGGMEYPTLVILGEFDTILLQHEIAHAYFYGALANNEQTEGWLDEGITTYQNELFINKYFPNYNNQAIEPSLSIPNLARQFKPIKLNDLLLNSLYYYFYSGFDKPLNTSCYELKNLYLYTYNVYYKPSKFFAMLDNLVGHETFIQILHDYYEQCKFTHVNSKKFQEICEQVAKTDLDWFFNQWIHATNRIDYACSGYNSRQQQDGTWETDVAVTRLGNGILPVEIEAITSAGDSSRIRWDGTAKHTVISLQTNSKVNEVYLDPDDLILDQNRLNNGSPRIKLFYYPEFPSMHYLPRDAYSLFLWHQVWYNDIDGLGLGVNVFGGYLNRYYVTRNSIWYGIKSQKLHYKLGLSSPWESIDHNLWRHFSILNIEGRREIDANLS
ncbi:MAG: M1 family metallopeptidase, partial [bacterium]|nr:M1 family metallopeptidase [bacterium]